MPSAHLQQQATDACQADASQTGIDYNIYHSVDYGLYIYHAVDYGLYICL